MFLAVVGYACSFVFDGLRNVNGKYRPLYLVGIGLTEFGAVVPSDGVFVFGLNLQVHCVRSGIRRLFARNFNVVAVLSQKLCKCVGSKTFRKNVYLVARVGYFFEPELRVVVVAGCVEHLILDSEIQSYRRTVVYVASRSTRSRPIIRDAVAACLVGKVVVEHIGYAVRARVALGKVVAAQNREEVDVLRIPIVDDERYGVTVVGYVNRSGNEKLVSVEQKVPIVLG